MPAGSNNEQFGCSWIVFLCLGQSRQMFTFACGSRSRTGARAQNFMMGHFFMIFCREKSAFFEIPGFIISRFRLATQNLEDEPYTKSYFQFSSIIRGHLIIFNSSLLFCYNNNNNIISLFLRNRVSTDSNPISSFLESLDPATICVYPNLPPPAPCFRMSENKEGVNIFLKSIYRYILELGRPDGRFIYPPISDVSIRGYPHNNTPPLCSY